MSIRVWLAVLGLLAFAFLIWRAYGVNAWVLGLVAAAVLIAVGAQYLKRPTGLFTAPGTLSCSGCKRRDREIRLREILIVAGFAAGAALALAIRLPGPTP
jgi:hypothetical protein